jgi:hypothetical protein
MDYTTGVFLRCTRHERTALVRPTRHRHLQANTVRRMHIELGIEWQSLTDRAVNFGWKPINLRVASLATRDTAPPHNSTMIRAALICPPLEVFDQTAPVAFDRFVGAQYSSCFPQSVRRQRSYTTFLSRVRHCHRLPSSLLIENASGHKRSRWVWLRGLGPRDISDQG